MLCFRSSSCCCFQSHIIFISVGKSCCVSNCRLLYVPNRLITLIANDIENCGSFCNYNNQYQPSLSVKHFLDFSADKAYNLDESNQRNSSLVKRDGNHVIPFPNMIHCKLKPLLNSSLFHILKLLFQYLLMAWSKIKWLRKIFIPTSEIMAQKFKRFEIFNFLSSHIICIFKWSF